MRFSATDFQVEEITADGTRLQIGREYDFSGNYAESDPALMKFTHFVLQKTNWNTTDALFALGRRLGVSARRFDFAGTKDRSSISTQMASVFGVAPNRVEGAVLKDIRINGAWLAPDKVRLGSLLGNGFRINLTRDNCGFGGDAAQVQEAAGRLKGSFPNYFGPQRFGSMRSNSAVVGKLLLQGDLEGAVMEYLTAPALKEYEDAAQARKRLLAQRDFNAALGYYPKNLGFERKMLVVLSKEPGNWAGAIRALPRMLALLFLHAFQSAVFNEVLATRERDGTLETPLSGDLLAPIDSYGFPDEKTAFPIEQIGLDECVKRIRLGRGVLASMLVGPEAKLGEIEGGILEREGVALDGFRMPNIPELNCHCTPRCLSVPIKGFEAAPGKEGNGVQVGFELPSGSYATVAIACLLGLGQSFGLSARQA